MFIRVFLLHTVQSSWGGARQKVGWTDHPAGHPATLQGDNFCDSAIHTHKVRLLL
jgi:hypothetical protein